MYKELGCKITVARINLLIDHELECHLWNDFDNVDSIASPQRRDSTFFHHVPDDRC